MRAPFGHEGLILQRLGHGLAAGVPLGDGLAAPALDVTEHLGGDDEEDEQHARDILLGEGHDCVDGEGQRHRHGRPAWVAAGDQEGDDELGGESGHGEDGVGLCEHDERGHGDREGRQPQEPRREAEGQCREQVEQDRGLVVGAIAVGAELHEDDAREEQAEGHGTVGPEHGAPYRRGDDLTGRWTVALTVELTVAVDGRGG